MPRLSDFVTREYLVERQEVDKAVRYWTPVTYCLIGIVVASGEEVAKISVGLVCGLLILAISKPLKHMYRAALIAEEQHRRETVVDMKLNQLLGLIHVDNVEAPPEWLNG